MSLLDEIEAAEDVAVEMVTIPGWPTIEFRGMSFARLQKMQESMDLAAVAKGESDADLDQMIEMIVLTAFDPATHEPLFDSERGREVLRNKSFQSLLKLMSEGSQKVMGVDSAETAGKDSSSTDEANPTPLDDSSSS